MQGGTHKETPHPAILVMDGAAGVVAEVSMHFGVVNAETVEAKEFELILGEAQFPGDVGPAEGKGIVVFDDKGHGEVVK